MSFLACLAGLREKGAIDPERAGRYRAEYERLERSYRKTMGKAAAEEAASRDVMDALDFDALQQRRQAALQVRTQQGLLQGLESHVGGGGKAGQYAIAVMEHHEAVRGVEAVENVRGALWNMAWTRMSGFLDRYRRDLLGRVGNGAEMRELVRALRGEATDNASARELAAAVGDTLEWLRRMFNQHGGVIPKLENWGLPQNHDPLAIAEAGLENWRASLRDLLSPAEMIDGTTGKPFADQEALDEALEAVFRNITSEGMDGAVPGAFRGGGKLANRRADHRFLVFKDADAWLAYNNRFGLGDPFSAIVGHIDSMTRDIAAMRVLGPNPDHTIRWLDDVLHQQSLPGTGGGKAGQLDGKARKGARTMDRMWRYYSGELTAVAPENRKTARFFMGLRNWNVLSKLGRAALSAIPTDPVFKSFTAKFNGLPLARSLGDYIGSFNPANPAHRQAAWDAGLVFHEMTQRSAKLWSETRGLDVVELTRRGADTLLRTTWLTPHTVASKQSLGLSFMRDWAEHAETSFDDLARPKRLALERYGIDSQDWDRLRSIEAEDQNGIRLLRPGDLARRGDDGDLDAAVRFFSLIDSETRFDTPGEMLRAQTALALGGRGSALERGTIIGELAHSVTQFKTYSVIMVMTHMQRMLYGQGGMSRASYAMMLPIFLTFGGFVALSLRMIALGQDPPDATEPENWARAFVTAGGGGYVGDIVAQGVAGQRGTTGAVAGFVTGPTIGSIVDPAIDVTLGNVGQAARGEEMKLSSELLREGRKNVPFGNAWWGQLAVNRMLLDEMQRLADPDAKKRWRRMEREAREQGTAYWWAPGDPLPERAPDWGNATGELTE